MEKYGKTSYVISHLNVLIRGGAVAKSQSNMVFKMPKDRLNLFEKVVLYEVRRLLNY